VRGSTDPAPTSGPDWKTAWRVAVRKDASRTASRSSRGGSDNEIGADLRACVGALIATAIVLEQPLEEYGLAPVTSVPRLLQAEADTPTDDLVVHFADGAHAFIQVKRTVNLGGPAFSKALSQFCASIRAGLGEHDLLVLACARHGKPIGHLQRVLARGRYPVAGAPTAQELTQLERLRALAARQLPPAQVEELLRRLVIWRTDPTEGDGAGMLAARLGTVVGRGSSGLAAARVIADVVGRLARERAGLDAYGFVDTLRRRKIALRADATPTGDGVVAQVEALAAYRERIVRAGRTLQLPGAPASLSAIPLAEADADVALGVPQVPPEAGGIAARVVVRVRGRVVVVGPGGSGKSTCLRSLAAFWAEQPRWPLPIPVHLARLARRIDEGPAALADIAASEVLGAQREALVAALERHLATGDALLLLDGLDEVRHGRAQLIDDLRKLIADLSPNVEVALAARPVAQDDARRLGWAHGQLQAPEEPKRTVDAIVSTAAKEVPSGTRTAWTRRRRQWVNGILDRDPALVRTPLAVALVALTAARSARVRDLPRTRAGILRRTLQDTIEQWEVEQRRRGRLRLGVLEGRRTTLALEHTVRQLSTLALAETPCTRVDAAAHVRERLAALFALAPGDAVAAADDAIAFWEEAGFLSFDDDALAAGVRPFAELGAAWEIFLLGERAATAHVEELRSRPDLWPVLMLLADLTPAVAVAWARAAIADASVSELHALTDAILDGAKLADDELAQLVETLLVRHLPSPTDGEQAATALVELPVPPPLRARVRAALADRFPFAERMLSAITTVHWDEHGSAADARLRAVLAGGLVEIEQERDVSITVRAHTTPSGERTYELPDLFQVGLVHVQYDAMRQAALRLARGTAADAELAYKRSWDVSGYGIAYGDSQLRRSVSERRLWHRSHDFDAEFAQALREGGHEQIARRYEQALESRSDWDEQMAAWDHVHQRRFQVAARVGAPAEVPVRRLRALQELADLFASWVEEGHSLHGARWIQRQRRLALGWAGDVCDLTGLDRGVVAAQAASALEDQPERLDWGLLYRGLTRPLSDWSRVRDPAATVARSIRGFAVAPEQVRARMMLALRTAPDEVAAGPLERAFEEWRRWPLGALLLLHVPDGDARSERWFADDRRERRLAAAVVWAARAGADPVAARGLKHALNDPDAAVRDIAAHIAKFGFLGLGGTR
jgi:NACHT domain